MTGYQYWERFIAQWHNGKLGTLKGEWSNPDDIPLYGNENDNVLTSEYIPEPWWGNDGSLPLYSVVINFNPGQGGESQLRSKIPYYSSYAIDIVNRIVSNNDIDLWPEGKNGGTRGWHKTRRAMPLLNTLAELGFISAPYGLENHLSVELIPWHTKGVEKKYKEYLKKNISAVYKYSICFAAERAKDIENEKLRSIVFLRMSGGNTRYLMKLMNDNNIVTIDDSEASFLIGNGKCMEFHIANLPSTRFISIWGRYSRNNFPCSEELKKIIQKVIG